MKISSQNLGLAIGQYLEEELVPKASSIQKVMLYMSIPIISSKVPSMVEQYKNMIMLMDGFTSDGMLDIDSLYPQLKDAVHKAGKVPIMGIVFDETDVDKIYNRVVSLAQE